MSNPTDAAYTERNRLVALLASIYPSAVDKSAIDGWDPEWHNCVYIELPWGQASWHFHDSDAHLFNHLPERPCAWDGHTSEQKYAAIAQWSKKIHNMKPIEEYDRVAITKH